jgi:NosR/NirI family nitrous oxide reductase transcriptional regulator
MNNQKIQMIRRITQAISFFFFAGVFAQAFSGLRQIYILLIKHDFSWAKIQPFWTPLAIVAVLSILLGRFFCGWFCAFGACNDFLFALSKKLFPKNQLRLNQKFDSYFKYLKYVVLVLIIVCVWTFNLIPADAFDPWAAFARLGNVFHNGFSWGLLVLALIGSGGMVIERFFCRYLCPLGAVLALLSKIKPTTIQKPSSHCGHCQLCSNSCPMNINLAAVETVPGGECIRCLKCVSVCRQANPRLHLFRKSLDAMTYVFAAIILFTVINYTKPPALSNSSVTAGHSFTVRQAAPAMQPTLASNQAPEEAKVIINQQVAGVSNVTHSTTSSSAPKPKPTSAPAPVPAANKIYHDGTYEGEADGFRPGLKVAVTVKKDQIVAIQIQSEYESRGFKEKPLQAIPQAIIQSQSTAVDAVSGATYTSRGIIAAVTAALNKARINPVTNGG